MKEHQLIIDDRERIFIDDKEFPYVMKYELKHSAGGTAELTMTIPVKISRVGSESMK